MKISDSVLNSLGGNKFLAMTNALVLTSNNTLTIKFKGSQKYNVMIVELKKDDTYSVAFAKQRGIKYDQDKSIKGLFSEDLKNVFIENTGLKVNL